MANPQAENGYTQIPNEILERLIALHLSPNQWQVLSVVSNLGEYVKGTGSRVAISFPEVEELMNG